MNISREIFEESQIVLDSLYQDFSKCDTYIYEVTLHLKNNENIQNAFYKFYEIVLALEASDVERELVIDYLKYFLSIAKADESYAIFMSFIPAHYAEKIMRKLNPENKDEDDASGAAQRLIPFFRRYKQITKEVSRINYEFNDNYEALNFYRLAFEFLKKKDFKKYREILEFKYNEKMQAFFHDYYLMVKRIDSRMGVKNYRRLKVYAIGICAKNKRLIDPMRQILVLEAVWLIRFFKNEEKQKLIETYTDKMLNFLYGLNEFKESDDPDFWLDSELPY